MEGARRAVQDRGVDRRRSACGEQGEVIRSHSNRGGAAAVPWRRESALANGYPALDAPWVARRSTRSRRSGKAVCEVLQASAAEAVANQGSNGRRAQRRGRLNLSGSH